MAADATKSSASADSYIGSFLSLTSNSEIRYEGFLFHINPHESTIGLRNVKSFGTEGRKKDGPQVLPIDKVYDYKFFRGSDIQDLQVISSPPVQSTPAVPNDSAIIQSHYVSSTSLPSSGAAPATNLSSIAQSGLPTSTFQGNLPLYQPVGNFGSCGSSLPPTENGNGLAMPAYWPGSSGSSGGVSHLQQQSLLPPPQGLAVSPPVQQQIQYPTTNAPLPGAASNFAEFSFPLLPTVSAGFSSSTSTVPPFALPSNFPIGQSTVLSSNLSPNLMPTNAPNANPTVTLGSSSPFVSPLTSSSLDVNPVVPPIVGKPRSIFGPALPYQTIAQSMPSIVEPSNATHNEALIPPLVTPGQLLQPGATTPSSSQSLWTSQKDIEIVQASTSEFVSSDPKKAQEPAQQLPSTSAAKLNGDSLQFHQSNRGHAQGRGNGLGGAALHTHHRSWGHVRGRGNGLNGAALRTDYNYRGHARGKGNGLNGAGLHPHHSNRGPSWGRENGLNGAGLHPHYSNRGPWGRENGPNGAALHTYRSDRGRGRGRGTQVSPTGTKFTEDFDFEAMNEKFNKVEVWGRLGKTNKIRLEDEEGDENDSDGDDGQYEEEDGLPKFDAKPFYVKDDFFDSLSCNTLNHESGRGRAKLSEQKRIDTETFGEFQGHRRGRGNLRPGRGGWSRGSYHGRGNGYYAGRGRGRSVWGRVT